VVVTLKGHRRCVLAAAVFPCGKQVVTGSEDKTAIIWDALTGNCVQTLQGHAKEVGSVAVFPCGSQVVTGSGDATAKIWEVSTGQVSATFEGKRFMKSVAVFPGGAQVLTGSREAMIWDVRTGELVRTLEGHKISVTSVAVFPDGNHVLTGSYDKLTRVWSDYDRMVPLWADKDKKVSLNIDASREEDGSLSIQCCDPSGSIRGAFKDINPQDALLVFVARINAEVQALPAGYTWKIVFPLPRPDRPPAEVALIEVFQLPDPDSAVQFAGRELRNSLGSPLLAGGGGSSAAGTGGTFIDRLRSKSGSLLAGVQRSRTPEPIELGWIGTGPR